MGKFESGQYLHFSQSAPCLHFSQSALSQTVYISANQHNVYISANQHNVYISANQHNVYISANQHNVYITDCWWVIDVFLTYLYKISLWMLMHIDLTPFLWCNICNIYLFIYLFFYSFFYSFFYLFIYLFIHSFIHFRLDWCSYCILNSCSSLSSCCIYTGAGQRLS